MCDFHLCGVAGTKLSDKFTGIVTEVVSGDCLIVKDNASRVERRINLSSIRAARMGRKGEKPEDWAFEAKEFLRQRLIGMSCRLLGHIMRDAYYIAVEELAEMLN